MRPASPPPITPTRAISFGLAWRARTAVEWRARTHRAERVNRGSLMIASDANDPRLASLLEAHLVRDGVSVFLTGAGISAESGIPTFRGSEGYWTVGSENYTPMEMATRAMFDRAPAEVWSWYLYRFGICAHCEPNPAHRSIAALERALGDGMGLITQNVDGLHQRAGSTPARTFAI